MVNVALTNVFLVGTIWLLRQSRWIDIRSNFFPDRLLTLPERAPRHAMCFSGSGSVSAVKRNSLESTPPIFNKWFRLTNIERISIITIRKNKKTLTTKYKVKSYNILINPPSQQINNPKIIRITLIR
jgi:hypothetical protein